MQKLMLIGEKIRCVFVLIGEEKEHSDKSYVCICVWARCFLSTLHINIIDFHISALTNRQKKSYAQMSLWLICLVIQLHTDEYLI